jgi:ATP-dependent Clp protease, protease subunit
MDRQHYILNKIENNATLLINGEISEWWGVGLNQVRSELMNMNASKIMVQISSGGGNITEGRAISSFINGFPTPIDTNGFGLVASIATMPLLAGKKVSMSKGSMFMIHNATVQDLSGESKDLIRYANLLDLFNDELANTYVDAIEKNNKLINGSREDTKKQVVKWMENETWFPAEKALEHGFIGEVTEGAIFYNKANALEMYNSCKSFKNAPAEFLNQIKNVVDMAEPTPQVEEKASFLDMFKALFTSNKAEVKELINSISNENEAEKLAEIENAKRIAKENGFFKEDVTDVIENKEVEESEESKQIAQMTAQIEAANAKIQALEESKLSPSAGDGGKASENAKAQANLIAPTKAHEDIINSLPNIFKR